MLAKYLAAEQAILEGKEARIGDRSLRMEDLPEIRLGRKEWEGRANAERAAAAALPSLGGLTFLTGRLDR
ncbi:MAG: hypothetical protein E2576_11050 [Alcaligenaceae bacterium]|nr:hypothetical protein [Alcaligenaceae bacterium SAGV5]MPS51255.1 hypothetical protein [Alcaligenaceae bacterium SAGV3]MPT57248.1 hypothetical protein [Alcaligenaceae bacterium]